MGVNDALINNSEAFIGVASDITDCVLYAKDIPALQNALFSARVEAMYLGIVIGVICGFIIGYLICKRKYGL